jgi:outer membrane protein assembly factor BamE (lipoprotein component of BamABCDE complex)
MIRSIASSALLIAFASLLPLTGCDRSGTAIPALHETKMTRANYDQIHDKASKEEVRAILGPPTSENTEDKIIYKRSTWRYVEGDKYINITFKNDELDSKDTNLGT